MKTRQKAYIEICTLDKYKQAMTIPIIFCRFLWLFRLNAIQLHSEDEIHTEDLMCFVFEWQKRFQ